MDNLEGESHYLKREEVPLVEIGKDRVAPIGGLNVGVLVVNKDKKGGISLNGKHAEEMGKIELGHVDLEGAIGSKPSVQGLT